MEHEPHQDLATLRRQRLENLLIGGTTLISFMLALIWGWHHDLATLFSSAPPVQPALESAPLTKSFGPKIGIEDGHQTFDAILMFGLFASLGLTAFAVVQYQRLRSALRRQQQAELHSRRLAMHDQLTGLANRRNFQSFAERILFERPVTEKRAVFLIDLDHFKPVNDAHGHAAGDKVLIDFAGRIEGHFPGGLVARFGGDEFAAITPPLTDDQDALNYARYVIAAVQAPFDYKNIDLRVGASVGVALIGDDTDSVDEAMRQADIALYEAKRRGRRQIAVYESALESAVQARSWMEGELRLALQAGDIVPYFQPIVDLSTRDVIGYEALARWRHKTRGMINPADFIPVAEQTGLVQQVCEAILTQSVALARFWPPHVQLSVNLSPVQLRDRDLAQKLLTILEAHDFPASRLEVEITENALITDLMTAKTNIEALRAAGVSVALDDFGTGASTLNHLRVCQFDKIKIDQTFVQSMGESHDSIAIISAILGLSRNFNLRCTAEGIENARDLELLSGWGCAEGQGYLFGRPAEHTAFETAATPEDSAAASH
ncbi:diguanylate cyclase (GGDEF)-like protein [Rhizobium sp. SG_E_25_P2]|uniref:putative bifunctional diguanylate cyclase/phosphodiesterase n=1 Tax=Rhizobium sp. SG_E_25_P2 TaxID=2879942 RepID=UPI002476EF74|nr:EAL domain-containing protein [Rhizobium sp. SG_E_25_P2]MDH6269386.1 diguanylate cyclase (GGDEF)-like protein [Rhizobium sp. SG_E_25_P2]